MQNFGVLLNFTFSNFKSFSSRQHLDLSAVESDHSLDQNTLSPALPGTKNKRWLKAVALYGANASGKSSMIEAFKALTNLVVHSAKATNPDEAIKFIEPFALNDTASDQPTAFAVSFVADDIRYEFKLALTQQRVIHESLRAYPKGQEQLWYERNWNPSDETYSWTPKKSAYFKPVVQQLPKMTLPNMLFLSRAISLGDTQLQSVFRWFKDEVVFLDLSEDSLGSGFSTQKIENDPDSSKKIISFLKHADLGICGAKITKNKLPKNLIKNIQENAPDEQIQEIINSLSREITLKHKGANEALYLPWDVESTGTQRLFSLIGPWIDILEQSHIVFIDELETSMHPLMVIEFLKLFFQWKGSRAQLIFSTHTPLLLDLNLMRRDQIWFTEKNETGVSQLYPLTDYHPRNDESLIRGYLTGRYGATPFIPEYLAETIQETPLHDENHVEKEEGNE